MELFFWSLKHVWTMFESFNNIAQARPSFFQYIDTCYNSKRIHQTFIYRNFDQFQEHRREKSAV